MVKKADGTWRPCGDFRLLNLITEADKYPLPNMTDITSRLAGCTVFSKLDLKKGYHQVPVHPDDVSKTAIITPFGLFEFLRMPFGLKNAGMTFQRFMDQVLGDLPFTVVYLDDILVASPDRQSHVGHLREVLSRLKAQGLVLNKDKCEFFRSEVDYLGLRVTAKGTTPLAAQAEAIQSFPQPATVKELQGFLGLVNFYRRYIPGAAKLLLPLTNSLRGGQSGSTVLDWSEDMAAAFLAVKRALISPPCLAHPQEEASLSLATDASSSHVAAVLQQWDNVQRAWQPLG
jgi:hypothetical protein